MNNLELKGGIIEMIAKINDNKTLTELKELMTSFIGNHLQDTDYWDELNDTEKEELVKAIEESNKESNHIPHEEVMKKYRKWLDK